jgi:hypothetical protein
MRYRLRLTACFVITLLIAACSNPFGGNPSTTPPERPTREAPPPSPNRASSERSARPPVSPIGHTSSRC